MDKKISRHHDRKNAMTFIYQCLLRASIPLNESFDYQQIEDSDFYQSIVYALENRIDLAELVQESLVDWKFERLGFVEQAILLLACGEAVVEASPKQVIIDEAIQLAKEFSDEESYKIINATLDKVLDI